jgi:DNA repair protein RadC
MCENMKLEWAMEDRPREKLARTGPSSLTNAELIAVLLGTGTTSDHVLEVAQRMLGAAENSLGRLAGLPIEDLVSLHGIGQAKALRFKAAIEIARRIPFETVPKDSKIENSQDAFRMLAANLGDLAHEEFWLILLNRRSKVLSKVRISQGGLTSTVVDPRVVFSEALKVKASSIIVAHNHPSGSLNPSQADVDLTRKLVDAGKLLDIQLIDHLIISGNNYCSFADSGLL